MRRVKIFSGSSHPLLVDAICERLGTSPANCEVKKFSNGETSVNIETSIRDQDVFIVQSGSSHINDSVMEMLILISACKGGSAKTITAVMPYFPYSRQSKKKSHRGAITARLLANLLSRAGIDHVITVDLHAPPSQGFFGKPVDNLHAEPLIAKWIRTYVPGWKDAVVVSKNPGGTKRVTSLADALRLNFGLVTTDRRRTTLPPSMDGSMVFDRLGLGRQTSNHATDLDKAIPLNGTFEPGLEEQRTPPRHTQRTSPQVNGGSSTLHLHRHVTNTPTSSPLTQSIRIESASPPFSRHHPREVPPTGVPSRRLDLNEDSEEDETDERAPEVITGRLVHGHIVDEDAPSPALSAISNSVATLSGEVLGSPSLEERDPMASSFMSTASRLAPDDALGGSIHAGEHSDDEEEGLRDPGTEHTVTLVGNVRGRIVLIMDDMIDQAGSWIAAAETVVKRGDAKRVYCIATHGLFGNDSLEQMEACECIDYIVVTNTYPISPERVRVCKKLIVLDISNLLSEAIRRNHYGESITSLFQHYPD